MFHGKIFVIAILIIMPPLNNLRRSTLKNILTHFLGNFYRSSICVNTFKNIILKWIHDPTIRNHRILKNVSGVKGYSDYKQVR